MLSKSIPIPFQDLLESLDMRYSLDIVGQYASNRESNGNGVGDGDGDGDGGRIDRDVTNINDDAMDIVVVEPELQRGDEGATPIGQEDGDGDGDDTALTSEDVKFVSSITSVLNKSASDLSSFASELCRFPVARLSRILQFGLHIANMEEASLSPLSRAFVQATPSLRSCHIFIELGFLSRIASLSSPASRLLYDTIAFLAEQQPGALTKALLSPLLADQHMGSAQVLFHHHHLHLHRIISITITITITIIVTIAIAIPIPICRQRL